jgi:hypothetical protein
VALRMKAQGQGSTQETRRRGGTADTHKRKRIQRSIDACPPPVCPRCLCASVCHCSPLALPPPAAPSILQASRCATYHSTPWNRAHQNGILGGAAQCLLAVLRFVPEVTVDCSRSEEAKRASGRSPKAHKGGQPPAMQSRTRWDVRLLASQWLWPLCLSLAGSSPSPPPPFRAVPLCPSLLPVPPLLERRQTRRSIAVAEVVSFGHVRWGRGGTSAGKESGGGESSSKLTVAFAHFTTHTATTSLSPDGLRSTQCSTLRQQSPFVPHHLLVLQAPPTRTR